MIDADPADGLRGDPAAPAPAPVGPSPTEDPLTVSNPVSFPSAKPGQPNVPVEGTYWEGNYLKWGDGNPEGKRPNTYASKGTGDLKLRARLFELGVWTLDDIDEAERLLSARHCTASRRSFHRQATCSVGPVAGGTIWSVVACGTSPRCRIWLCRSTRRCDSGSGVRSTSR